VAARGRESGVVHRFGRELQIEVGDVNVRGGRLRVIDKEGDWGGEGGSDGDGGYGERRMIIAARSCESGVLEAPSFTVCN
jgi:hypothetical protein